MLDSAALCASVVSDGSVLGRHRWLHNYSNVIRCPSNPFVESWTVLFSAAFYLAPYFPH